LLKSNGILFKCERFYQIEISEITLKKLREKTEQYVNNKTNDEGMLQKHRKMYTQKSFPSFVNQILNTEYQG
jgi:hypothetical protein